MVEQLFMVYDLKGEPFEVRPDKAKKLVIEHGWSLEPPKAHTDPAVEKPAVAVAETAHEQGPGDTATLAH